MKFKAIDTCYDDRNWQDTFIKKINDKYNSLFTNLIDDVIASQHTKYNELIKQKSKYKKEYNGFAHFLYCSILPFAFLLLVYPGILLLKKIKKIKIKKNNLLNELFVKEKEVLDENKKITSRLPITKFINDVLMNILGYIDYGFITDELISNIKALSVFNFVNDENNCTLNSSWGVFNNNLVINCAKLTYSTYMKQYVGSTTITYTSNGSTYTDVVNATFEWPYVDFGVKQNIWCFSEYVQELEFKFKNYYSGKFLDKHNVKKDQIKFENEEFQEHYSWSYNSEHLIRMVFTPYFQELYLKINNNEEPRDYYKILKKSLFFSSERNCLDISRFNDSVIYNFNTNPYTTFSDFKTKFEQSLISYFRNWYDSLSFMTIIPIIQSEDQRSLIDKINSEKKSINTYFIQYVINEILCEKMIERNTETMHIVRKFECNDYGVYEAWIDAYSYDVIQKVKYVSAYSHLARKTVNVPINYVDFQKRDISGKVYFLAIENKDIHFDKNTNNEEIRNLIQEVINLTECKNVVAKNGFISLMTVKDFDNVKLFPILNKLKTHAINFK